MLCSSKVQMNRLAEQRPAGYVSNKLIEHFFYNENFEHWQIFGLKNLGAGSRKECLQGVLHSLKSSCLSKDCANKIS